MVAEFDALTGSKLATIDIGSPVVRMAYSPTSGHSVIAILEVGSAILKLASIITTKKKKKKLPSIAMRIELLHVKISISTTVNQLI